MSPALLPAASSLPTSSFDPVLPVGAFAAVVQIARNAVDFALCWLKARVMRSAIVDVFGLGFTSKTPTWGFVIGSTVRRFPCARCGAFEDRISAHLSQRLPKSIAYQLTCARSRAWRSAACRVGMGGVTPLRFASLSRRVPWGRLFSARFSVAKRAALPRHTTVGGLCRTLHKHDESLHILCFDMHQTFAWSGAEAAMGQDTVHGLCNELDRICILTMNRICSVAKNPRSGHK